MLKTKYILHGGFASHVNSENDLFFKEILKEANKYVKVLLVFFSKEIDRIPVNKDEDIVMFNRNKDSKDLQFEIAIEDNFINQVKNSDVIYFHGGNSEKLVSTLRKFTGLGNLFKGKIVAGESAGANALSKYYYSLLSKKVSDGIGLVNVKTIPHFDGKTGIKELKKVAPDLESCYLAEYGYKSFFFEELE